MNRPYHSQKLRSTTGHSKLILRSIFLACLFALSSISVPNVAADDPPCSALGPTAITTVTPDRIAADEWALVTVTVQGYSAHEDVIVPFDAILVIDHSGSMESSDPHNQRLAAALEFIAGATAGSGVRIGIVFMGDEGFLVSPLTDDYPLLVTNLTAAYLGRALSDVTNFAGAMEVAQNELISHGASATRIIVFLTDGEPTPDPEDQLLLIDGPTPSGGPSLLEQATEAALRYYTIGLSSEYPVDSSILRLMANNYPGGEYLGELSDAGLLVDLFHNLFDSIAFDIFTGRVVLNEVVNPNLRIRDLHWDPDLPSPTSCEVSNFYSSGILSIGLGDLVCLRNRSISFFVQCTNIDPDSPDETTVPINAPGANVTYFFGDVEGGIPVTNADLVCLKPGALHVEKNISTATMTLSLFLKNNYLSRDDFDNTLRNISITEELTAVFQATRTTLRASDPAHFVKLFPSMSIDKIKWTLADLAPQEEAELTFNFVSRACKPANRLPLPVNKILPNSISFVDPRGVTINSALPERSINLAIIEECNPGRPDLHIEADYTFSEYTSPPPATSSFPDRVHGEAAYMADYMFDSPSVWVDAQANGLVEDWSNPAQVRARIHAVEYDPDLRVLGQGDLLSFSRMLGSRLYVSIRNVGINQSTNAELKLFLLGKKPLSRIELARQDIGPISPGNVKLVYATLTRSMIESLSSPAVQFEFSGPRGRVIPYVKLGVEITAVDGEKHTNNNYATEYILLGSHRSVIR